MGGGNLENSEYKEGQDYILLGEGYECQIFKITIFLKGKYM